MNVLDIYVSAYRLLYDRSWLHYRVLSPFRYLLRREAAKRLPVYLAKPYKRSLNIQKGLIVSFTSFPDRIKNVWQVVECMLRQTVLPEKIILWLSKEQFPSMDSLPQSIKGRINDIFEVRLVDGDIKSHKKYYYVSKEFRNNLVFLIDDDIYYPTDIIDRSLKNKINNNVVCNYSRIIEYDVNGKHLPYSQWKDNVFKKKGKDIFLGTGGGTLLRFSELFNDVSNINLAMSLTPTADDVWINAMIRLANLKIETVSNGFFLPIEVKYKRTLSSINVGLSMNDKQILAIEKYYGNCFDK